MVSTFKQKFTHTFNKFKNLQCQKLSDKNLLIYLFAPNVMFSDNCYIKGIPNDVRKAKVSFKKSFVNSLSFLFGMMLLNLLKGLVFGPFEIFFMVFYCSFQRSHFLMLIPF